nr:DUF2270 domain-containing protein [Ardenticatena sp.]
MSGDLHQPTKPESEPVWHYNDYALTGAQFLNAMVHFYRGEMERANVWRTRLDTTTNWAVVTTATMLSFVFSDVGRPHFLLLLTMVLVLLFLIIEARRYRYYELWSYRLRLMEMEFFAAMLVPPFRPDPRWAASLATSLQTPHFTITFWEAFGRRFRRQYQYILLVLWLVWMLKIYLHPYTAPTKQMFIERAALGVPGEWVLGGTFVALVVLFFIGWWTSDAQRTSGEIVQRAHVPSPREMLHYLVDITSRQRRFNILRMDDRLVYVITTRGHEIAEAVLHELSRGVTRIEGQGMYTGEHRDVLLVAVSPRQVGKLKRLVYQHDPHAFVIVQDVSEVVGMGFRKPSRAMA